MSWGGATDIMFDVCKSFNEHEIPDPLRRKLYIDLIESFQSWGSVDDCLGADPMFDEALEGIRRRWCESNGDDYDKLFGDRND